MSTAAAYFDLKTNGVFDSSVRDAWIVEGEVAVSKTAFCERRYQAVALWAAHNASLAARNTSASNSGDAGPVRSKKQGRLSKTYGGASSAGGNKNPGFEQTSFGRDYLQMLKTIFSMGTTEEFGFVC